MAPHVCSVIQAITLMPIAAYLVMLLADAIRVYLIQCAHRVWGGIHLTLMGDVMLRRLRLMRRLLS